MTSLTLITGTIDEAEDPFGYLDAGELYYEIWEPYDRNPRLRNVVRENVPIRFYGHDQFRIVQYLGSGKTVKAVDILARKVFYGGTVAANLGLVWHNEGKEKDDWIPAIQTMKDFQDQEHSTVLLDDIKGTIIRWNVKEADMVSEIANAGRKVGLDIIITAQREKMIPPELRDLASEWMVPIIRVRDMTRDTPDGNGYPVEMISLHFDGAKVFKGISKPIIGLDRLFECYSTMQKAIKLKEDDAPRRVDQVGYKNEEEAILWLRENAPGLNWKLLNGKEVFDIVADGIAIDVVGMNDSGGLNTDHKSMAKHINASGKTDRKPWLMFKMPKTGEWRFLRIHPKLAQRQNGKKISIYGVRPKRIEDII